jgi:hypothetical protein
MRIEHNHNWVEITEEEYNKHIIVLPENASFEQVFKTVFCHNPKEIVKRELIIPEHICGILNVGNYIDSNDPDKKYKYYKSIGMQYDFIVSPAEYEILKDDPSFKHSYLNSPDSPKRPHKNKKR